MTKRAITFGAIELEAKPQEPLARDRSLAEQAMERMQDALARRLFTTVTSAPLPPVSGMGYWASGGAGGFVPSSTAPITPTVLPSAIMSFEQTYNNEPIAEHAPPPTERLVDLCECFEPATSDLDYCKSCDGARTDHSRAAIDEWMRRTSEKGHWWRRGR